METLKKFWATVVAWFTMIYHLTATGLQMFWWDVVSLWWRAVFFVVFIAYKPIDLLAKLILKVGSKLQTVSDKLKVVLISIRVKW
jgi:hypothetical protein